MMKILHLSYKDSQEGAAIAAERLSKALIESNIESKMLVQTKTTDFPFVKSIMDDRFDKIKAMTRIGVDLVTNQLLIKNTNEYFTLPLYGSDVHLNKMIKETDVIHLHWINRGYVTIKTLERLSKYNKPIVWTLHDSWPFTGGCHTTSDCDKYMYGCPKCEFMRLSRLSKLQIQNKQKVYDILNLSIIAPSSWMKEKAINSYLLNNREISTIPNCLDTEIFKPIDKMVAKDMLGLPKDKPVILFLMSRNIRKGNEYINRAMSKISQHVDCKFISFGSSYVYQDIFGKKEIKCFGKIHDSYTLSLLYNAADVYISPALEEPFGQTYSEAMACATPCVGFNFSGPKDIIDHQINGYLAKYLDVDDLAKGIETCIVNAVEFGENARKKATEMFSYKKIAQRHVELYGKLLNEANNGKR